MVVTRDVPRSVVALAWLTPDITAPDADAVEQTLSLLGAGQASRLHRRLVRQDEIAESVSASSLDLARGNSLSFVSAAVAPGADSARVEEVICEEIERLIAEGPDDQEVERVGAQFEREWLTDLAGVDERADRINEATSLFDDPGRLNRHLASVQRITAADVTERGARPPRPLGPHPVALPQRGDPMTTIPRPVVPDPQVWHFPAPEVTTLANGLALWVFRLPGQHVIAADLVIDLPLAAEPRDREGVGLLCARVADEGTRRHPGPRSPTNSSGAGAAYSAHVWHTATVCSLDVPSTRLADRCRCSPRSSWSRAMHRPTSPATSRCGAARSPTLVRPRRAARRWPAAASSSSTTAGSAGPSAARRTPSPASPPPTCMRSTTCTGVPTAPPWSSRATCPPISSRSSRPDSVRGPPRARKSRSRRCPAGVRRPPRTGRRVVHLVDRPDAVQAEIRICGRAIDRSDPRLPSLQVAAHRARWQLPQPPQLRAPGGTRLHVRRPPRRRTHAHWRPVDRLVELPHRRHRGRPGARARHPAPSSNLSPARRCVTP